MSYIARTIGVSIAWFIARLLNAFYTSTRGAQLFAFGLFTFLHKRNWAHYDSSTGVFNAVRPRIISFIHLMDASL